MADTSVESTPADLSKYKVADLKKELKTRGLSTAGNKNELLERLQISVTGADSSMISESDSAAVDSEEILDEDVLEDDVLDEDISSLTKSDAEVLPVTTVKRKLGVLVGEDKAQLAKKVVLNRNVVTSSEKENNDEEVPKLAEEEPDKKVVKLSTLSVTERLEMRAQKFGISLTVDAKKKARAERFGQASSITSSNVSTSIDVLKKRAERFGGSVSSKMNKVDLDEKLKKRQERFGSAPSNGAPKTLTTAKLTVADPVLQEKKVLRAERFKIK